MEKINATLVLEILGRPPEHIKKALIELVEKLGKEKEVKITGKTIHDPNPVKDTKDIFTAFAEISLEFDSLANYFGVMFAYMPAHIEIISPTNLKLSNNELNELGNKLLSRLHDYDAITKKFVYERNILLEKLKAVAPQLFKKVKDKTETKQEEKKPEKPSKKPKK